MSSELIETGEYLIEIQNKLSSIITKMENAYKSSSNLQTMSENGAYEGDATADFKTLSMQLNTNIYKLYEYYKMAYAYQTSVIKEFAEANEVALGTINGIAEGQGSLNE